MMHKYLIPIVFTVIMAACTTRLPSDPIALHQEVSIYPDYRSITIPVNIAPLNYSISEDGDDFISHIYCDDMRLIERGQTVDIQEKAWHKLLNVAEGKNIFVEIYVRRDGKWYVFPKFSMKVAGKIDPYISYRLLEPSYVSFEEMSICQRNLENFEEKTIFTNTSLSEDNKGQCINCHSYQNYNRDGNMQMHVRINHGGTVIFYEGESKKVNLKTAETLSAGVYPSWHPSLPLIAYSNNTTDQHFHSKDLNKIEVQDAASDIVLYDVAANTISFIANDTTELETFPYWNHDGTALYYVSASLPDSINRAQIDEYKVDRYKDIKYDIYRKPFDIDSKSFGPSDTIFRASIINKSATFPRESPNGRYLLFTLGDYGTFHIWHKDADLWLMDLKTGEKRAVDELNSPETESYHSWSSDGRWVVFSSRRDDGNYTRLYIANFDPETGLFSRPFLLPQKSPSYNQALYKSYNIPELMVAPVNISRMEMLETIKSEPISPTFVVSK